MKKRSRLVLRHKKSGLYFDSMASHSSDLWTAWRFLDAEQMNIWLATSRYAPNPNEYESVEVEMTIEEMTK